MVIHEVQNGKGADEVRKPVTGWGGRRTGERQGRRAGWHVFALALALVAGGWPGTADEGRAAEAASDCQDEVCFSFVDGQGTEVFEGQDVWGEFDISGGVYAFSPPRGYFVRFRYKDSVLQGWQARATDGASRIAIDGDVRLERTDVRVRAERMAGDLNTEVFTFSQDVVLVQLHREGPDQGKELRTIRAAEITYDSRTGDLVASGDVRIEEAERHIVAGLVQYREQDQLMVMEDRVVIRSLRDPEGELVGNRFRYDIQANRIEHFGPMRGTFRPRADGSQDD